MKGFICFILGLALISSSLHAQTITINKNLFAPMGTKVRDSSNISIPVTLDERGGGNFGFDTAPIVGTSFHNFKGNKFLIYISNNANPLTNISDTTNPFYRKIGQYTVDSAVYTTFVNGYIPLGTPIGHYYVRVISTTPFYCSDSVEIDVVNSTEPRIRSYAMELRSNPLIVIRKDSSHLQKFYGTCYNDTLTRLVLNDASINTTGFDSVIFIQNNYAGLVNTNNIIQRQLIVPGSQLVLPVSSGKYYTLMLKGKNTVDGCESSVSYFILNTNWVVNLNTTGNIFNCTKQVSKFYIIPDYRVPGGGQSGIIDNFPGVLYKLTFGDPKRLTPLFGSYAQQMRDSGVLYYTYDTTSCFSPGAKFNVIDSMLNRFYGLKCINSYSTISVSVLSSTKAKIKHPVPSVCINDSTVIRDISFAGQSNGGCQGLASYRWFIAPVKCGTIADTATNAFQFIDSTNFPVPNYNLVKSFSDTGKIIIKLLAINPTCNTDAAFDSIMVVHPPHTAFKFDTTNISGTHILSDTLKGCAPKTFAVVNLTDSTCTEKSTYTWDVLDSAHNNTWTASDWSFGAGSSATDLAPSFVLNSQGQYVIRLIASNPCKKADTVYKTVYVVGNGSVIFKLPNYRICANTKTLSYDILPSNPDKAYAPTYGGSPTATAPYTWTVTPLAGTTGTASFAASTTANSQYPTILFKSPVNGIDDGIYTVSVTYNSQCGTSSASQTVYLNEPIGINITSPLITDTFCYGVSSIPVCATVISPADGSSSSNYNTVTSKWSYTSVGAFYAGTFGGNQCDNFNLTKQDVTGTKPLTLTYTANIKQPNACPNVTKSITVSSYKIITNRPDTSFTICSGAPWTVDLSTLTDAAFFSWTSSGTANGNTPSGTTKLLNDILTSTTGGTTRYTVIPSNVKGCVGNAFHIDVTVLAYPAITTNKATLKDTLCSGSPLGLNVTGIPSGTNYVWSASMLGSGNNTTEVSGTPSQLATPSVLNLKFQNPDAVYDAVKIVLYPAAVLNGTTCPGLPDSLTIFIPPGQTKPLANTPKDSIYSCNLTQITMNANTPTVGNGLWSQSFPATPKANIVSPTSPTTKITLLQNIDYIFKWEISSPTAFCPPQSDSVTLFNRNLPTPSVINPNIILGCNYVAGTNATTNINGSGLIYPYENGTWTVVSTPPAPPLTTSTFQSSATNTSTANKDVFIFNGPTGEYTLQWTITNDGGCAPSSSLLKIVAGISNNAIKGDTGICLGQCPDTLRGTTPSGGGGSITYEWYGMPITSTKFSKIPGATSKDYLPPCTITTTTSYYRKVLASCLNPLGSAGNSDTVTVRVFPKAKAYFSFTKDTACAPYKLDTSVIKIDTNTYKLDSTLSYQWFANGQLIGTTNNFPSYILPNQGDFARITLVVTSSKGCSVDSMFHNFQTYVAPNPSFTYSLTNGVCNTSPVVLTNTTPNRSQMYGQVWDFVVSPADTVFQPTGLYTLTAANGKDSTYCIKLTTWTNPACHDTVSYIKCITILSKPHASFYPSVYGGCSPLVVNMFNTSIGLYDSAAWYWNYPNNTIAGDTTVAHNSIPLTHTFYNTSNVALVVSNQCGTDTARVQNIQISNTSVSLSIGIPNNHKYACAPHTSDIIYNAAGADKVEYFEGTLGGTLISQGTTPITAGIFPILLTTPGKYVIQVTASNICNSMTVYDTITIFRTPKPGFTLTKDTLCIGDVLNPINTTDSSSNYYWNFSNANKLLPTPRTSISTNPSVFYQVPGTDSIKLGATISYPFPSPGFCTDTFTHAITVVPVLKANFTVSNYNPSCLPATVNFTNNSPVGSTPATWSFYTQNVPAGPNSFGNTISHVFSDTGSYSVVLDTKSAGGCQYLDTQIIKVVSPYAQVWKYTHGWICGATPVRFEVMNPSGVDSGYLWHFGDTSIFTNYLTPVVYHSYSRCNTFQPSVDLIAKAGCTYTMNWNVGDTIKIDSVKADFTYQVTNNCGSTFVNFADMSTACSGESSWAWNFNDIIPSTNTSTLASPNHTYFNSDIDSVSFQVTAKSGCVSNVVIPINIKVKSVPQIATHVIKPYNGVTACTGQEVRYQGSATSIDPIKDYLWTFSAAVPNPGTTAAVTYPTTGVYLDTFTVTTINGCSAFVTGKVTVNETPVISISPNNPPQLCRGVPYTLTANSTVPSITRGLWGPSSTITCIDPACSVVSIMPQANTNIYVQGLVTNGCTGYSDTIVLKVIQPITLSVRPLVDTFCIGDSVQLLASAVGATVFAWNVDSSLHVNGHFLYHIDSLDSVYAYTVPNPWAVPSIGNHAYTVRATNGCFRDSAIVNIAVGGYPSVVLGSAKGTDTIFVQTGSTLPMNNYIHLSNDVFKDFAWTPTSGLNCSNCQNPIVTIAGSDLYSVKATTIYGCSDTDYMFVSTFCQNGQVYIPNAFTPDNDGINDILMVRGSGIKSVKSFRIYNRWGQVVFERANFAVNDPQFGWNGMVRNTNIAAQPDVYMYYCEVVCDNDVPFTYKGNIALIK